MRWQIVPAIFACAGAWLLLWLALTVLAGRLYCSIACPMGVVMDVAARLRRRRPAYFYRPGRRRLRRSVLIVTAASALAGVPLLLSLLDPAAAFSRMVTMTLGPLFRPMAVSLAGLLVALLTAAVVGWVAYRRRGRLLCNTICPVGALLAEISPYAIYRIDINTDVCVGCGLCTARCKAECIDPSAHTVDAARCVMCFDCLASCPTGAIGLRRTRHQLQMPMLQPAAPAPAAVDSAVDTGRRTFVASLLGAVWLGTSGHAKTMPLKPLNYVRPPGWTARKHPDPCIGCGACMAACPEGIIKPSTDQTGLRHALSPILSFENGSCRYDCVACTRVCPSGAIEPLTVSEKHREVIGKASLTASRCIVYAEGRGCGECVRRCPVGAIRMTEVDGGRRAPAVDFDACIGCGACAYVCPTAAYTIEGEP